VVFRLIRSRLIPVSGRDMAAPEFTHYPVGAAGKYAERGADYQARTLTNCRAWLAAQEAERQRTMATIATLRRWGQTHSFADLIPAELRGKHYRSDSTDTKVFDAVCNGFEQTAPRGFPLRTQLGKKRLAKEVGLGSSNTTMKALARLSAFFSVTPDGHGLIIELRDERIFPAQGYRSLPHWDKPHRQRASSRSPGVGTLSCSDECNQH
jgi:hypothetical protein